ncbi:MAG: TolC family protein, partial [Bradymonadia bacterium]
AYLAWLPTIKLEAFVAPLPERKQLRECVDLSLTNTQGLNEVFPCPGQDLQADERITIDTDIGLLARGSAKITLPIYTFGKMKHAQRAARSGVMAGELGIDYTREEVAFLVRQAYYGAQMTKSSLSIIEDALKRFNSAKDDIETSLKAEDGKFTTNDLRKLVVQQAEVEARHLEVISLDEQATEALRIAANLPVSADFELDTYTLKPVNIEPRSDEEFLELAMGVRLDLQMSRSAVSARRAQVDMAKADFYPNIALVGAIEYAKGTTAEEPNDPFASDPYNFLNWGVVIGATWNLDFAVLRSDLKRARSKLLEQEKSESLLKQRVRLDLVSKISDLRRREKEIEIRAKARSASKSWLVSNTLNFGLGLTDIDQLLKSLNAYSRSKLNYLMSVYEYNLAVARVSKEVGLDLTVK